MEYKIIVTDSKGNSKEYHISNKINKIGRASTNDIVLRDKFYTVSRFHCEIEWNNDRVIIRDLGSKNGTFVNNDKIINKEIYPDDIIKVGSFILILKKRQSFNQTTVEDKSTYTIVRNIKELENYWERESPNTNLLKPLIEVAKILLESRNLNYILETTTDFLFKYVRPERVFMFLKNGEKELELKFSKTIKDEDDKKSIISRTIINKVFEKRVSILSIDTKKDERFQDAESVIMGGIQSVISVPMFYNDNVYGVIYIDRIKSGAMFNEKDLEFVTVLSNYISIAVQQSNLQLELEDEKMMRAKLEKYHSPAVISKIIETKDMEHIFDYTKGKATIMFIDIVGFTSLSEKSDPVAIGKILNNFFAATTEIIFKYKGTLDKYIGDAVMAIYGMPVQYEEHEKAAVLSAIEIRDKIKELNSLKQLPDLKIRIGIASGPVIAGNFGSMKRMEFTVIGQTVNLASRLEEKIARQGEIIINGSVHESCGEWFNIEYMGKKEISGFSKKMDIYKVLGEKK